MGRHGQSSIAGADLGADHAPVVVAPEALRFAGQQDLAARVVANDPLERREQLREIGPVAGSEAEQLHLRSHAHAEPGDPLEGRVPLPDQVRGQPGIAERVDLAQDVERRRRPDELGVHGGAAAPLALLDEQHGRSLLHAAGGGGQAGHAATEHEDVHAGGRHVLAGSFVCPEKSIQTALRRVKCASDSWPLSKPTPESLKPASGV